jgi:hypothetical protein
MQLPTTAPSTHILELLLGLLSGGWDVLAPLDLPLHAVVVWARHLAPARLAAARVIGRVDLGRVLDVLKGLASLEG